MDKYKEVWAREVDKTFVERVEFEVTPTGFSIEPSGTVKISVELMRALLGSLGFSHETTTGLS